MNLREIVEVVGLPIVDLSRQSGVSRFRLYSFLHGDLTLKDDERKAVFEVLLRHGLRVREAIRILQDASVN